MSIIFPFSSYKRIPTKAVLVGSVGIGGSYPIRIQTMTNTNTNHIHATVEQIKRIYEAGADLVRIAVPTIKEVSAIKEITTQLKKEHIDIPIIADVHFVTKVAEAVAPYVQKVRINPGNYVNRSKSYKPKDYNEQEINREKEEIRNNLLPLLNICKQYGTAIRIGINYASLSWRMVHMYGNTPQAMVASALEFLEICNNESFENIIFSFKASDIRQTLYANRLFVQEMLRQQSTSYPIHLGITEAGLDTEGRLKSLIGIGMLLHNGIGDTIRVSLTEPPENELPVAKKIIELLALNSTYSSNKETPTPSPFNYQRRKTKASLSIGGDNPVAFFVSSPNHSADEKWTKILTNPAIKPFTVKETDNYFEVRKQIETELKHTSPILVHVFITHEEKAENVYLILGSLLAEGLIDAVYIETTDESYSTIQEKLKIILQVTGARRLINEYISCPSCGRTLFDIESIARKVKEATQQFSGYKIAVMGCIVNGPGEMHDADFGLVGAGNNKVNLYHKGKLVKSSLPLNMAIEELVKFIQSNENHSSGNWQD